MSTVYQEVNLIPHLSVAENICLGRQPTRFGLIRWRAMARRAEAALARVDLKIDVSQPLSVCSIAMQQLVAIARALDVSAKLLVLDEPTSSLDEKEVKEFFNVIRKLRAEGMGIVFVTHFLDQVYAISDRITVLRDGRLVGEYETAKLPQVELVSRMIGKALAQLEASLRPRSAKRTARPETFLELRKFGRAGFDCADGHDDFQGRNRRPGWIAWLRANGNGAPDLRHRQAADRRNACRGAKGRFHSPRQAIRDGFAFTPENRKVEGIIPHLSVRENIILALQARQGATNTFRANSNMKSPKNSSRCSAFSTPGPEQAVMNLSGGNQQKVLLARWLATHPRLLILDEPTRGIDVGAKAEIEKLIQSLRAKGMAILFISSELEEVVRDSQRVIVLRDRARPANSPATRSLEETIMHTIAGHERGARDPFQRRRSALVVQPGLAGGRPGVVVAFQSGLHGGILPCRSARRPPLRRFD